MGMRMVVGRNPSDESLVDKCGPADSPLFPMTSDPECTPHAVYGEEYCGTVARCMFTIFRCMIGDCSSRGGQSLTEHMSYGFGWKFDVVYCLGMIVLIFGLFNVIAAIFVEATMAGLKYNETKQKLQSMYQSQYVERKLRALVQSIRQDPQDGDLLYASDTSETSPVTPITSPSDSTDVILTEADFFFVFEDKTVRATLAELDIDTSGNDSLFEILDFNDDGKVSLASMIETLMKLRGGLMKSDMVAPWVALNGLRQEFRELAAALANTPGPPDETSRPSSRH